MVYILTGDRDSFQLIDKFVNVIYTKKGITETEIVNEKVFTDKYGIKVNQYIDYLALKGDASDNIPGVPGIGEKTALSLLKQYSSIEGILRNIDELKPKQKENLETFKDQINLSRELATIVTDLNIKIDQGTVSQTIFRNEDLIKPNIKILEKYELNTFLKGISKEANNTEIDKINLLLVSTTKNIIREHASIMKNSGFRVDAFDADPIAIANMYKYNYGLTPEGADVILNIGGSTTNLIVWGKNFPFFTRNIEISGNYFTNEIMREFDLDYQNAENLKIEKGINAFTKSDNVDLDESTDLNESNNSESNFGISVEKKTCFNELCEDIKRTLRFYMKNNHQAFFNHFYITGGSAKIPGINDFIASALNVKVSTFDPLQKISNDIEVDNPNQYTTALGLALRGLDIE